MARESVDLLVVGGGVNGCGIARDAAGRGYSVVLAEMGDLASGTSSTSSKLIHGGLRYLEHHEFRLVREALREREVLLHIAPHVIRPARFVIPVRKGMRPAWLIRLGLFLYDTIGGRSTLGRCRSVSLRESPAGRPLKADLVRGFEYSDRYTDDARLVVLNAMDAALRGARIMTRTRFLCAEADAGQWLATLEDVETGETRAVRARMIINAAGPWAGTVRDLAGVANSPERLRLVKGSHIVIRRKYEGRQAYVFQNLDRRIVFAIPFEDDFTLIGTTDEDFSGDPHEAGISDGEIRYLCETASAYFSRPVVPSDIVWSFAGVRPLYDDGSSRAQDATRDYVLKVERHRAAPLLNVFGGKITTYRRLAEAALDLVGGEIGSMGEAWTAAAPLPGGDFPAVRREVLVASLGEEFPFLSPSHARRLVRQYGTLAQDVLGNARQIEDLGRHFGASLYECELRYLAAREWARTADDVLWRRTKLGLRLDAREQAEVACFMESLRADSRESPAGAARRKRARHP